MKRYIFQKLKWKRTKYFKQQADILGKAINISTGSMWYCWEYFRYNILQTKIILITAFLREDRSEADLIKTFKKEGGLKDEN